MRHWSQLTDCKSPECHGEAEIDNRAVFQELQSHPQWGNFFHSFGNKTETYRSQGAQAELFHAHVTWKSAKMKAYDAEHQIKYVLKVFKKGTFLSKLKVQWLEGMFVAHADIKKRSRHGKPQDIRYNSEIKCGTLVMGGRFAFLMRKEANDLRKIIEVKMENMETNVVGHHHGPFSLGESERMIYDIALGMDKLHSLNIVHRDLKAANVLVSVPVGGKYLRCYIADFECSIGVVGTGFFRAPEVLRALKEKKKNREPLREDIFTKEVDVYSYGMVCYEILTDKSSFEDHNGDVLNGERSKMPEYVSAWMRDLLKLCWQTNPRHRPTFRDVIKILLDKPATSRKFEELRLGVIRKKQGEWK